MTVRNEKLRRLAWFAGCFALALTASGRTLNWVGGGGSDKNFSTAANWQDTAGKTNAVPRSGDTLQITYNTGAKNDIDGLAPYKLCLSGYQEHNAASTPLVFTTNAETCAGIENTGFLHCDIALALVGTNVPIRSTSTLVFRSSLFSADGNPCGIRTSGSGLVALNGTKMGSNPSVTQGLYPGFKYVDIAEGSFSFGFNGGDNWRLPSGMVVTFSGKNTSLMLRGTCSFANFGLRETGTAVGAEHTICAQNDGGYKAATLKMYGTMPQDTTTFSGTIIHCVNFTWAPDSALQTFVFDGGVSTTTGNLTIEKGTVRLVNGASFTQLNKLTLSGGANSVFAVDAAPSQAFYAADAELTTGAEKLVLTNGVSLRFGGLTVNGARVDSGVYTGATGAFGQQVDWIEGAGLVLVSDQPVTPVAWTWTGNGADTRVSNPENWGAAGSTALPPLDEGTMDVTFSKGGTITVDTNLFLYGVKVTANEDVTFAGAKPLMLGDGGFKSVGVSGRTYTFGTFALMSPQTWVTQEGETLNLNGEVYGFGSDTWTLNTTGTVNFAAVGHQSGPMFINAGLINVSADYALGRGNTVTVDGSKAKLTFRGGMWSSLIDYKKAGEASLTFAANTTNVFLAAVQNKDGVSWGWTVESGGVVRFKGGNHRGSTGWTTINGPGETHFDAATSYGGSAINGSKAKIYFNAEKCDVGSNWMYVNDGAMEVHTTVPKAFSPDLPQRIWMNGPVQGVFWDLHGCDQWVKEFQAASANGLVKSANGALLHFKTASYTSTSSTNKVTFAGGVGVSYDDSKFLRLCTPSTSTGTVQVTSGRLELATTWANATAAVVKGGTL